ncbi:hypothetical protein [Aquiflexum sp.]|uniref:hypothetical protein n=1 Tax=Aquiflexum sp. TaxID=1872584 RepID=UPI003593CD33
MKLLFKSCTLALLFVCFGTNLMAQKKQILVDVAHGQKFYSDPANRISTELVPTQRLEYMTGELAKNAATHNAEITFLKASITSEVLSKVDLLFIHVPSIKYSEAECKAIHHFLEKGGSLFIAIEEDFWATLDQINANDLVSPFGIKFFSNNPDQTVGGYSTAGTVTKKKYAIPFHGARLVDGGAPFAFSNRSEPSSFAVFTEIKGGGKIIAMGEAMVSLYMTSWQEVNNYECAPFMEDVIGWLLK